MASRAPSRDLWVATLAAPSRAKCFFEDFVAELQTAIADCPRRRASCDDAFDAWKRAMAEVAARAAVIWRGQSELLQVLCRRSRLGSNTPSGENAFVADPHSSRSRHELPGVGLRYATEGAANERAWSRLHPVPSYDRTVVCEAAHAVILRRCKLAEGRIERGGTGVRTESGSGRGRRWHAPTQ